MFYYYSESDADVGRPAAHRRCSAAVLQCFCSCWRERQIDLGPEDGVTAVMLILDHFIVNITQWRLIQLLAVFIQEIHFLCGLFDLYWVPGSRSDTPPPEGHFIPFRILSF